MSSLSLMLTIKRILYLFPFCFLFNLLFSNATSPLLPAPGVDPHVFEEFGLAILHGKIPYVDIFDHKGLYLFMFNALGLAFDIHWGVSILQSMYLAVTISILLRTIEEVRGQRLSLSAVGLSTGLVLLSLFVYESGNMSEDWSLLFIALPIYYLSRSIVSSAKHVRYRELLVIGLCFGIVTFIRANNIFPVFGFLLVVLSQNIIRKNYCYIFKGILVSFSGFLTGILPAFLFQYYKGGIEAVDEMIFGSILSNLLYSGHNTPPSFLFLLKSFAPIIAIGGITVLSLRYHGKKIWIIALLLSYVICSFAIGKVLYRHYFLIYVPLFPLTLSLFLDQGIKGKLTIGAMYLIILVAGINPLMRYIQAINSNFGNYPELISQFDSMIQRIPESERQSIWNYDATEDVGLFVQLGLVQYNRFMFPHHKYMFERFRESEPLKFSKVKPKWVVMKSDMNIESQDELLFQEEYQVEDSTSVLESDWNVILLRRTAL